jgi:ribosomal protein L22
MYVVASRVACFLPAQARLALFSCAASSPRRAFSASSAAVAPGGAASGGGAAPPSPGYVIQELPEPAQSGTPRGSSVVRSIRGHTKKLSPLARQVAGLSVNEALAQMAFSSSQRARDVSKAVARACKQVELFHGLPKNELMVEAAWTGKHTSSPRLRHHSKMRAGRAHKRTSQLSLRVRKMTAEEAGKLNRFQAGAKVPKEALNPRGY